LGGLLRIFYTFTIHSVPVSDFAVMYDAAGYVLKGDYSSFWGTGYMARFPHITITTLYFAGIRYVSSYPLLMIKIVNVLASTCNIFIIYNIVKELFISKGKAIIAAILTAVYPPLILYTAVFTTENLAVPFILASIYMFILFIKNDIKLKYLALSALFLFIGHLFRMVGQILLIAFILYIVISYKEKIKKKLLASFILVTTFLCLLISTSFLLNHNGIIQYSLWKGSETCLTNIVKGLNIESGGRWNEEDAKIPEKCNYDNEEMVKECEKIIKDRLTTTPKGELLRFFVNKYSSQWAVGDFAGSYWAECSLAEKDIGFKYSENGVWFGQAFYVILVVLSYIGLLNIDEVKTNKSLSLIYYIFCGYSILYLVSENQERYGFIGCWLFIIMAIVGINLLQKVRNLKGKE
jgi:4-amino-4-deoxy-L-arabinose transferase-like glycosyltransferase